LKKTILPVGAGNSFTRRTCKAGSSCRAADLILQKQDSNPLQCSGDVRNTNKCDICGPLQHVRTSICEQKIKNQGDLTCEKHTTENDQGWQRWQPYKQEILKAGRIGRRQIHT
jgi:hypothetical protein